MSISLELNPEIERRVNKEAVSSGKTVETFLVEIIKERLFRNNQDERFAQITNDEELENALDDVARYSDEIPLVVDDSRESIYGERENAQF